MKQAAFYAEARATPFRRDLSDRRRHFEQRDSLLRHLGIVPRLLKGNDVLELGPGHGENALYLLRQAPASLTLVEASEPCAEACRELLTPACPSETKLEILAGTAEELEPKGHHDVVVFEGVIPFEPDPPALLRHAARFVAPGGVLCVTCIDAVSLFSEALRRLIALLAAPVNLPRRERVERLAKLFTPHLATLAGMTRSAEDWVLDQMVHPWTGKPLSILDAARTLAPELDLHGSSPAFLTDWRWFRDVHGDRGYLELAEHAYHSNVHNLIDYRFAHPAREPEENRDLIDYCEEVLAGVQLLEHMDDGVEFDRTLDLIDLNVGAVEHELGGWAPQSAEGLMDFRAALHSYRSGYPTDDFGRFAALFGRGQQYVSFVRREEPAEQGKERA